MEDFEYRAKDFVLYLLGSKKPLGIVFGGMPRTELEFGKSLLAVVQRGEVRGKEISWKTYMAVQQKY